MTDSGGGVQAVKEVAEATMGGVDLRIFVRKGERRGRTVLGYELQFADEPREVLSSLETQLDPHTFFTEFWAEFNRQVGSGSAAGKSSGWLSDKSAFLTRQVLPEDLQERLWELRDDVETLQIHSEEGWIPWELLQLQHRTASGTREHGPFLAEAFSLTRWHGSREAASAFSLKTIGCLVAAADELPHMTEEANDLKRQWDRAECDVEDLPNDLDALRQRWSAARLDGLHVIGHGRFRGQRTGSVSIDLGEPMTPEILDGPAGNVARSQPLVFFNTCHSARSGQALIDINSWAAGFIRAGAGAFIGAAWPIEDHAACLFAKTFYDGFFRGLPIGKAVSLARAEVKDRFPGDPTWLAHVVYAHPLAVYQRGHDELHERFARKERRARLALSARPTDRIGQGQLAEVLESVCSRVKKSLGVDYTRYRSAAGELPSLGFGTVDEAHDFGSEILEALERRRLDTGEQDPYLSIGLCERANPGVDTNPDHLASLGPTGQIVVDRDSWSGLSRDRRALYGSEELVRPRNRPRSIHVRRARVTSPAPKEVDLVKLQEGKGLDPTDPPYIGPDFFSDTSRGFFGRNREIRDLCGKIERNDYTLVFAPSGAGKSSLVHTGVPAHLDPDRTECILVRYYLPSDRIEEKDSDIFFACLRDKLKEFIKTEGDSSGDSGPAPADLLSRLPWGEGRKRVLILDQFENSLLRDDEIDYMNVAEARERFFHQLRLVLRDFALKLVLVFREEYLAKVKDLCEPMRESGFNGGEFYLKSLDERAALEVIRNHARMVGVDYEEGLAEKIVRQLSKNKEIAPVQLQVVCRMIWESLTGKEGTKVITSTDVASAAGDRSPEGSKQNLMRNLEKFIKSSVQQFYYRKLEKIAAEDTEGLKVDIDLLHIGCMEFVSSSSHHDALQREGNKVGRLPEAIVNRLEDEYLIRRVERDGKSYYELIHDTVADAISAGGHQFQIADWQAKRFTKDPNKLLYALKSLEFLVKRYKSETSRVESDGESPKQSRRRQDERASFRKGLFIEHDEMLKSIEGFQKRQGLFEDEADFVLRCVLSSDKDIGYLEDWAQNIANEYPNVFNRVLLEAIRVSGEDLAAASERRMDEGRLQKLQEEATRIRKNAVLLAGAILERKPSEADSFLEKNIKESIVACALEDAATSVWLAAAASLAKLEPEDFAIVLTEKMASSSGERLDRIYDIFVELGEISYSERAVLTPETLWPRLDLGSRARALARMWWGRLKVNLRLLMTALVLAVLFTPSFTGLLRAPFAQWGLTHSQAVNGAFQGVFHALAAGTGWAFGITIPLMLYWILFELEGRPDPRLKRKWMPALVGGFGGLMGGLVASSFAIFVFTWDSLVKAGWLTENLSGWARIVNSFVETRFGLIYPITGTCVGAGAGLLIASLSCSNEWRLFLAKESDAGPLKGELTRVRRMFGAIVGMILKSKHCLWILVLPQIGAVISYWLLVPGSGMEPAYAEILLAKSLCDALTFFSGGIGLATGVLYSFVVDATGVTWENRRRRNEAARGLSRNRSWS